jgi:hypothetical protein
MVHFILKYLTFHMEFWTNPLYNDIYKIIYVFLIKCIKENYNIYNLIIIKSARILMCKMWTFQMSKASHFWPNHGFTPNRKNIRTPLREESKKKKNIT